MVAKAASMLESYAPRWLIRLKRDRPILFWFIVLNCSPIIPWTLIIPGLLVYLGVN